jgi:hypothetical protein
MKLRRLNFAFAVVDPASDRDLPDPQASIS